MRCLSRQWSPPGQSRLPLLFFFLQAEDGIRYLYVTGVQTCALPICMNPRLGLCTRQARRDMPHEAEGHHARLLHAVLGPDMAAAHRDRHHRQVEHPIEPGKARARSEEHTSELQSRRDLVCRLLLEKK